MARPIGRSARHNFAEDFAAAAARSDYFCDVAVRAPYARADTGWRRQCRERDAGPIEEKHIRSASRSGIERCIGDLDVLVNRFIILGVYAVQAIGQMNAADVAHRDAPVGIEVRRVVHVEAKRGRPARERAGDVISLVQHVQVVRAGGRVAIAVVRVRAMRVGNLDLISRNAVADLVPNGVDPANAGSRGNDVDRYGVVRHQNEIGIRVDAVAGAGRDLIAGDCSVAEDGRRGGRASHRVGGNESGGGGIADSVGRLAGDEIADNLAIGGSTRQNDSIPGVGPRLTRERQAHNRGRSGRERELIDVRAFDEGGCLAGAPRDGGIYVGEGHVRGLGDGLPAEGIDNRRRRRHGG